MHRVALIGCGGIQVKHLFCLRRRGGAEVVAVMDTNASAIASFCEKQQLPDTVARFTDLASLYKHGGFDIVSISTPHTLHFEQSMQALEHNCHVLLEKPMVTDSAEARVLAEKVKSTGKVMVVGYNATAMPEVQYLRDRIADGSLGKLELVSVWITQGWKTGTTGLWRQKPELSGGGMAYDSGAHPLSTLLYCVNSDVSEVYAWTDNVGTPVDINCTAHIRFKNGVSACVVIGGNCPASTASATFIFDNGRVDIDPWQGTSITVFKGKDRVKYPPISSTIIDPVDNILDAIEGKAHVIAGPELGTRMSDLMDAIYASAKQGKPVRPA